jgi:hypothetical protein
MTIFKPLIIVNRLLIYSQGKPVFDEKFHRGVNIIRGKNSSGKSTISNFIFYGLGGDFQNWTSAAEKCDKVYLEVEINGASVTLRRNIELKSKQGMSLFYGDIENAIKTAEEGWLLFSYSQSEIRSSFSNVLFSLLGLPELKGDVDSNITMHQILRLLYIDQKSNTESLMRSEIFDSAITRTTVSELLFGVYDDSIYMDKQKLRSAEKEHDLSKRQVDGIIRIYGSTGNETDKNKIQDSITDTKKQLIAIDEFLKNFYDERVKAKSSKEIQKQISEIQNLLIDHRQAHRQAEQSIRELVLEIQDSKFFIEILQRKSKSIEESIITRKILGTLPITHCPHCLSELTEHIDEGQCKLCKNEISPSEQNSQAKRMQQELMLQIKESENLLNVKNAQLSKNQSGIPPIIEKIKNTQRKLDELIFNVQSTHEKELEITLINKGKLENSIENFIKQLKAVEQLDILKNDLIRLRLEIDSLKDSIKSKENQRQLKVREGQETIQKYAILLLEKDLYRQGEFRKKGTVVLDFNNNTYSLDGKNNFSESSNTYFKNSIRFAIFFASLEIEWFRFPRFIFCDNIEDKGMEVERSQNFQKALVDLSNQFKVEHQMIFTTSMINPTLNNTFYCVGEFYDETNKTLDVS